MSFGFIYRQSQNMFNPLNAELIPICDFLALLGAHHMLHVSRIRVNKSVIWVSKLSINSWVIWQQSYYRTGYIAKNEMERWSWIYIRNLEGNGRRWFGVYVLEFFRKTCVEVGQKLIFRQSVLLQIGTQGWVDVPGHLTLLKWVSEIREITTAWS